MLRLRQVLEVVGLSKSAIYKRITAGTFPKAINLGGKSVGWLESEVLAWLDARIIASPDGEARLHRSHTAPPRVTPIADRTTMPSPPEPVKPKRDDTEHKRAEDRRHKEKLDALLAALRDYLIDIRSSAG